MLTTNELLFDVTQEYEAAIVVYSTIEVDGYGELTCSNTSRRRILTWRREELNVKEIRPPHMDYSGRTEYPVLFHVYLILFLFLFLGY